MKVVSKFLMSVCLGAGISVVNASAERTFMDDMFDRIAQESGRLGVTFDGRIEGSGRRVITGIYRSLAEKQKLEGALKDLRGKLIEQRFFKEEAEVPADSLKFLAALRENIVNEEADEAGDGGGGGAYVAESDEEEGPVLPTREELTAQMAEKTALISRLESELAAIDFDAIAARIAENRAKLLLAEKMLNHDRVTGYQDPPQLKGEQKQDYVRRKGEMHTKYGEDVERARADKAAASEDLSANQEALRQESAKYKRMATELAKTQLDVTSLRQQIERLADEEEE